MTQTGAELAQLFRAGLGGDAAGPLGLAISGGGDSMAMLHLAAQAGVPGLRAVTVDHGLREAAAQEAAFVGQVCAGLGIPHDVLQWRGWDGQGNLQAEARRARYGLMAGWARDHGIACVALAHTKDDQAETLLMRLARGAGVDGLSGMAARRQAQGVTWLRPLLGVTRGALRAYLNAAGQAWCEDPSNDDPQYERVRMRAALAALAPLGVTSEALGTVAANMAMARAALDAQARAAGCVVPDQGDLCFDAECFFAQPEEIQRRLLDRALKWVASAEFGPRAGKLREFSTAMAQGRQAALHGCLGLGQNGGFRITREYNAVRDTRCAPGALWDGRWRLSGPYDNGLELRALGEDGLRACPAWRETGVPRAALLASPAVWRGDNLLAAPRAGFAAGWRAELAQAHDWPL